jgi:hypothetical protein
MKKKEDAEYKKRLEDIAKAWDETSLDMVKICRYIEKINKLLMISKRGDKDVIIPKGKYYVS